MGFAPDAEKVTLARERAASAGGAVLVTTELEEALLETDAVYVEPWPADHGDRFRPYAIQRHSLRHAHASVQVLHRFPERRGPELSASLAEEGGWLAMEQSRARADAFGALLWSMLRPDTMLSVIR
jgi:ornithine carbamoyltransferase